MGGVIEPEGGGDGLCVGDGYVEWWAVAVKSSCMKMANAKGFGRGA